MSNHGTPAASWWGPTIPTTGPTGTAAIWLGAQMGFSADGWVEGFRCYLAAGQDGNSQAIFWNTDTNELLVAARFRARASTAANAWHQTWFHPRVKVNQVNTYRLAVLMIVGRRFQTTGALAGGPVTHNNVDFVSGFTSTSIAVQTATLTLSTFAPAVDVLFRQSA